MGRSPDGSATRRCISTPSSAHIPTTRTRYRHPGVLDRNVIEQPFDARRRIAYSPDLGYAVVQSATWPRGCATHSTSSRRRATSSRRSGVDRRSRARTGCCPGHVRRSPSCRTCCRITSRSSAAADGELRQLHRALEPLLAPRCLRPGRLLGRGTPRGPPDRVSPAPGRPGAAGGSALRARHGLLLELARSCRCVSRQLRPGRLGHRKKGSRRAIARGFFGPILQECLGIRDPVHTFRGQPGTHGGRGRAAGEPQVTRDK